jgi:hypothetical protein
MLWTIFLIVATLALLPLALEVGAIILLLLFRIFPFLLAIAGILGLLIFIIVQGDNSKRDSSVLATSRSTNSYNESQPLPAKAVLHETAAPHSTIYMDSHLAQPSPTLKWNSEVLPVTSVSRPKEHSNFSVSKDSEGGIYRNQSTTNKLLSRVKEAEHKDNLRKCLDGGLAILCDKSLLTDEEKRQAREAERKDNARKCLDGGLSILCNKALLTEEEKTSSKEAERRDNLRKCLDGGLSVLCNKKLLSEEELAKAQIAEERDNLRKCLDGGLSILCNKKLLEKTSREHPELIP